MATKPFGGPGHSAQVLMELRLNGHIVPIAQMGLDYIVAKDPIEHPPADAEVFLSIDGSESNWRVHLVEGISPDRRKTRVVKASAVPGP